MGPCLNSMAILMYRIAIIKARAGHLKGTKLDYSGIRSKSLAGRTSSGGLMAVAIAERNRTKITPNITKKQSQIESSPSNLQNLLVLDITSSMPFPLFVLTIRMPPSTLVASHLSRMPFSSAICRATNHKAINTTPIKGAPNNQIR